jgi:hypothetical protein
MGAEALAVLQWQSPCAVRSNDPSDSFGVLHFAYLSVLSSQDYLFPFVVSQALPWAFGYSGNSVAMRVSPFFICIF